MALCLGWGFCLASLAAAMYAEMTPRQKCPPAGFTKKSVHISWSSDITNTLGRGEPERGRVGTSFCTADRACILFFRLGLKSAMTAKSHRRATLCNLRTPVRNMISVRRSATTRQSASGIRGSLGLCELQQVGHSRYGVGMIVAAEV
jgi:hypothetical protein